MFPEQGLSVMQNPNARNDGFSRNDLVFETCFGEFRSRRTQVISRYRGMQFLVAGPSLTCNTVFRHKKFV